ncbi:multiple epidermal growth factor-like domains protein 10 [Mytilus edulis]|uniref:multiple epidermal growth factor-like domains protein 10 n=1 Tax=Mytilus edulis TaxID=6550 RepID=UPI0039EEF3E2
MYDCHCQNREPCDKHTGRCTYCHDGWIGKACQQTCEVGKYGTNCNETCLKCKANLCDHETGHCLHGCITGWEGYLCNTSYTNTSEKHSTSNLIIGSVVVGIVLVIIIIIVLTIYRWWKRKGSSTIVSDVPPEAETVFDGQSVKRVNHHSSSLRLSTSSDESVHSLISI